MADDKEPMGVLSVSVQLAVPHLTDTPYKMMNHPFPLRSMALVDLPCTQVDGRKIVEKMRAANPHNVFNASWTGGTIL
jgi:hypothetical protein